MVDRDGAEKSEKRFAVLEKGPGLKPQSTCSAVHGPEQAAEKGHGRKEFRYLLLQGLKPNVNSIGFVGTTKVMPCYKASGFCAMEEFFRSL